MMMLIILVFVASWRTNFPATSLFVILKHGVFNLYGCKKWTNCKHRRISEQKYRYLRYLPHFSEQNVKFYGISYVVSREVS